MKKIIVTLVLLLSFMCAQTASAATLSWSSVQPGALVTNDNASAISLSFGFQNFIGAFSHSYSVTANPAIGVQSFVVELLNVGVNITEITLDSVAMTLDGSNQWVGFAGPALTHNIFIKGSTNQISQQYLVYVNAVPVPAAVWLFGSALMGLVVISRRKVSANGLTA